MPGFKATDLFYAKTIANDHEQKLTCVLVKAGATITKTKVRCGSGAAMLPSSVMRLGRASGWHVWQPLQTGSASGTQIQIVGVSNWPLPCRYAAAWIADEEYAATTTTPSPAA